jgi:hypothetical protein
MSTLCPAPCGGCSLPILQDYTSTSVEELRGHFMGVKVDLIEKKTLKPAIGRHILQEVIPVCHRPHCHRY